MMVGQPARNVNSKPMIIDRYTLDIDRESWTLVCTMCFVSVENANGYEIGYKINMSNVLYPRSS